MGPTGIGQDDAVTDDPHAALIGAPLEAYHGRHDPFLLLDDLSFTTRRFPTGLKYDTEQ